ncbi:MAG: hypothetical protein JNL21_30845 [Myxococcales bacterium]|nr:hypothetical protein [Myxococcales bacterium]
MLPAARVGDSVEHDNWTDTKAQPALMFGVAVLVVVSGGTFGVFIAAVGAASTAGGLIDTFILSPSGEKIKTGADTVYTNLKKSALAHEKCKVEHGYVSSGAEHVFIEESNASRLYDRTTCTGKISEANQRKNKVMIGGKPVRVDTPGWYTALLVVDSTVSAISLGSAIRNLGKSGGSFWKQALEKGGMASDAYGILNNFTDYTTQRTLTQHGGDTAKRILGKILGGGE